MRADAREAARCAAVSVLLEGRDRVEVANLFKVPVKARDQETTDPRIEAENRRLVELSPEDGGFPG